MPILQGPLGFRQPATSGGGITVGQLIATVTSAAIVATVTLPNIVATVAPENIVVETE